MVVVRMKQNDRLSRIRQKQRLEGRQHFQNPFYTCALVYWSQQENLWLLLLLLPSVREKLELTKLLGNSGVRKENDEKEMWIEKKKKKKKRKHNNQLLLLYSTRWGAGPTGPRTTTVVCVCGFIQTYGHWKKGWNLKLAGGFLYSRPNVVWLFTCRVHFHFLFGRSAIVNIGSCDPHYSRRIEDSEGHRRENEREPFSKLPTLERIQLPYYLSIVSQRDPAAKPIEPRLWGTRAVLYTAGTLSRRRQQTVKGS